MPRLIFAQLKSTLRRGYHTYYIFIAVFGVLFVLGCSRTKDAWTNRTFHQTTSKFNPYFNGEQALLEGKLSIIESHRDNYEEILPVYIWGTADAATTIAPKMDRAQEKGVKVIKDHSMLIGGKQKNPYTVKAYLLIGEARFYKHDFLPALETFNYVIQQFQNDKDLAQFVKQAQLWAGRSQTMLNNNESAEQFFTDLLKDKRLDKNIKHDIHASLAQVYINTKDYEGAILQFKDAIQLSNKKDEKIRWTFIIAQLHERLGNNYEASQYYLKVAEMKPNNYEFYFTAQLNRAKNFDIYMENSANVYRDLEKMLKDEKNLEYRDQIYYVMGQIAMAEEEFEKAESFFKQSIRNSINNNKQKGISYLTIADIEFNFKEYVPAQAYYDSASTTLPSEHKKYSYANKRKESLLGLVTNIRTIELEDSLQRLAQLSPEQQLKLFQKYVKNLRDEDERKRREEELRELNEQLMSESSAQTGPTAGATGGGWYFYNSATRSAGMATFKREWGNRKLEDNWRLKNKMALVANNENDESNEGSESGGEDSGGGRYDPQTYIAQIPKTKTEIDSSTERIQLAFMNLGAIYKEELNDSKESEKAYNTLLSRYPDNKHEPKALYSLYRLFVSETKPDKAENYKKQLLDKYPFSVYAKQVLNPGFDNLNKEEYQQVAELYKSIYKEYEKDNYKACIDRLNKEKTQYELSLLAPKFALLEAMCLGKMKKEKELMDQLKLIVEQYPNTPEAAQAKTFLDMLDEPGTSTAGTKDPNSGEGNFAYEANAAHKYVVILPNQGVDINVLRNEFANFNQEYFKLERLQMQNIFFDDKSQMIIISGLKNAAKAKVYFKAAAAHQDIMKYLPAQVTTKIIISDQNYRDLYRDKNLNQYLNFMKSKYQIQEKI